MPVVAFLVTLLLDVRAPIPNQPSFGSDPAKSSFGTRVVWAIAAFFVTIALLSVVLLLAVRLAIGLL
jgi:hypothetical protein